MTFHLFLSLASSRTTATSRVCRGSVMTLMSALPVNHEEMICIYIYVINTDIQCTMVSDFHAPNCLFLTAIFVTVVSQLGIFLLLFIVCSSPQIYSAECVGMRSDSTTFYVTRTMGQSARRSAMPVSERDMRSSKIMSCAASECNYGMCCVINDGESAKECGPASDWVNHSACWVCYS